MARMHRSVLTRAALLAALAGVAAGLLPYGAARALDTDIYFSNPHAGKNNNKPNVLFILDTSGSMVSNRINGRTRLAHMKEALITILDTAQDINVGLMRFSGEPGGPILYPVSDLDAVLNDTTTRVEVPLAASSDDAEQPASGGTPRLDSPDLDMHMSGTTSQITGIRFQNVLVPRNATIKSAYIRFTADESTNPSASLLIKAQDAADPGTFTTAFDDVRSRTSTSGLSVVWDEPPGWIAGESYTTPDLTPIVQSLVQRTDWCGGQSMVFTVQANGTSGSRIAVSFDSDPTAAPTLVVEYEVAAGVTDACMRRTVQVSVSHDNDDATETEKQTCILIFCWTEDDVDLTGNELVLGGDSFVGVRFAAVDIPKNATIASAHIDFNYRSGTGQVNASITAQKTGNPGRFNSNAGNVSGRVDQASERTAKLNWNGVATTPTVTTPDLKALVQELVNQNDWAANNAMLFVLEHTGGNGQRRFEAHDDNGNKPPILRVSYQYNVPGAEVQTVRTLLKNMVNEMEAAGNTPIVDTLYEAGLYFRGKEVHYGKVRGNSNAGNSARRVTRVSHPKSWKEGTGTLYRPSGCTEDNLNDSDCIGEQIQGNPEYISPFAEGCQNNYIVLLTDGDPTVNYSENLVEALIGQQCAQPSGLPFGSRDEGRCAEELVAYYANNDLSDMLEVQSIKTFTIGFGGDGNPNYLRAIAEAGGTGANGFFEPKDSVELTQAFQEIIGQVLEDPTSFVSPSLSVNAFNKLFNRDEVYFSLFSPQLQIGWPGNIKKFKLCADASNHTCTFGEVLDANGQEAIGPDSKIKGGPNPAKSFWSSLADGPRVDLGGSGENVPGAGSRRVYTLDASDNVVTVSTTNVSKAALGDAGMSHDAHADLINWMRGKDVKDEDGDGVTNEDRWKFADALHSRPLTVTYGGTAADPVIAMFVGTNDGGLRMINTDDASGKEEWILYLPEYLDDQKALMDNEIGTHIVKYNVGLDGTPTAYVIDHDSDGVIEPGDGDRVYLYIGQRRGGESIYAFDVTPSGILDDPSDLGSITPRFMWRIRSGDTGFERLAQTWSRPLLARILVACATGGNNCSEMKDVLLFAGGYDPRLDEPGSGAVVPSGSDMGNAIYIVDPLDGSLIWWASGTGSNANLEIAGMDYAIPSDLALLDSNHDGAVDRIYVGDTRGQLFRIDLGDRIEAGSSGTGGSSGYVFADVGCPSGTRPSCTGTAHHDRRKFFYPPDVAQVRDHTYSSTPEYDLVAIGSGDREDPLDKLTRTISTDTHPVHNRVYAFRDYHWQTGAADSDPNTNGVQPPAPLTESDLFDVTNNPLQGAAPDSQEVQDFRATNGWYIDLRELGSASADDPDSFPWIGEKALARPTIFDGVLMFTTFVPTAAEDGETPVDDETKCGPLAEGVGRAYALNFLTATPAFDIDGDGSLDRYVEVGGGIPSEVVVVIREGGVSTLIGTSGGAASPKVNLSFPRYQTYWREE